MRSLVDIADSNFDFDDNTFDFDAVGDDDVAVVVAGMDLLVHDIHKNYYYAGCHTTYRNFDFCSSYYTRSMCGSNLDGLDMVCFRQFRLIGTCPVVVVVVVVVV